MKETCQNCKFLLGRDKYKKKHNKKRFPKDAIGGCNKPGMEYQPVFPIGHDDCIMYCYYYKKRSLKKVK